MWSVVYYNHSIKCVTVGRTQCTCAYERVVLCRVGNVWSILQAVLNENNVSGDEYGTAH